MRKGGRVWGGVYVGRRETEGKGGMGGTGGWAVSLVKESAEGGKDGLVLGREELTSLLLDVALSELGILPLLLLQLVLPVLTGVGVEVLHPAKPRLLGLRRVTHVGLLLVHPLLLLDRLTVTSPQGVVQLLKDGPPADPGGVGFDSLLRLVVEADNALHHPEGLVQRAVPVIVCVGVLLEEVLLDDLPDPDSDLVLFTKGVLPDQLHNLREVLILLKHLGDGVPQPNEVRHLQRVLVGALLDERLAVVVKPLLLVVRLEGLVVLREGQVPVHGGEVLPLGKLLVKPPENLHDPQSCRRDGVGEVPTRRRHSPHDGDGTLTFRRSQALHTTSTLVEGRQTSTKVRGVPRVCRHFGKTPGDLTKGLSPPGSRVGHHGNVKSHVPRVLRQCDACVDRGLTRSNRHVRGVGHQGGTRHDRHFTAVVHPGGQLRELHQHLSHFVTALTAPHVDDSIRVRVLGEGLRDHRLPAPKGTGDTAGPTLHTGEERVEHTLPSLQRGLRTQLPVLRHRTGLPHRPLLNHGEEPLLVVLEQLNLKHVVGVGVVPLRGDPCDDTTVPQLSGRRGEHDLVLADELVFVHHGVDVTPVMMSPTFIEAGTSTSCRSQGQGCRAPSG
eukprot:Sspe_Gene.51103::Locus_28394_Transcript_1_1_Confidence_1.000_Length_2425::g.51103::m.51103